MQRKKYIFIVLVIFILLSAMSCTQYKDIVYMQDRYNLQDTSQRTVSTKDNVDLTVKYDDNLYVNIYGANLAPLEMFSKSEMQRYNQSEYSLYMDGYMVDNKGFISLPLIGNVYVLDKTLAEIQEIIQKKINEYVVGAVAEVRLLSFKVTVLGEVRKPGTHSFLKREINLLEVLGAAGDIADSGNKKNVMIVRKNKNGITETFEVDMTHSSFFGKDAFWIKPNDIVYVKPLKAKMTRLNSTTASIVMSSLSTLFSALTTLVLILNYMK